MPQTGSGLCVSATRREGTITCRTAVEPDSCKTLAEESLAHNWQPGRTVTGRYKQDEISKANLVMSDPMVYADEGFAVEHVSEEPARRMCVRLK